MATPISRRTILAAGAGAAAGLSLPGVAAYADGHATTGVRFSLNAQVLDGGEQVTSITLNTARLGPIDPASLTTGTFTVHAKATSPIPIAADDAHLQRVRPRPHGDRRPARPPRQHRARPEPRRGPDRRRHPRLHREQEPQRQLDLAYTITQNAPIVLRNHRSITIRTSCRAGCRTPRSTRSAPTSPARE